MQHKINAVIEEFDFVRVHSYLKSHNIRWKTGQGIEYTPTIEDLKFIARLQLSYCAVGDTIAECPEGFLAKRGGPTNNPSLTLYFFIEMALAY